MRARVRYIVVGFTVASITTGSLGGCAQGNVYQEPRGSVPSASAGPSESDPPASGEPSPSGFSDYTAVACNGSPGVAEILNVLRKASVVSAGAKPTVTSGPLCAGTWQYTVFSVPQREPLDVVTEGRPGALRLVTAGTNPCSAEVRGTAPPGILSVINC